VEFVASLSQGSTAAAHCGLFTYKSVPDIFEPPCIWKNTAGRGSGLIFGNLLSLAWRNSEKSCEIVVIVFDVPADVWTWHLQVKKVRSVIAWVTLFFWSRAVCNFREISYATATVSTIFAFITAVICNVCINIINELIRVTVN